MGAKVRWSFAQRENTAEGARVKNKKKKKGARVCAGAGDEDLLWDRLSLRHLLDMPWKC